MNRREFSALLLSLGAAGCDALDIFKDKKQPLPGERISVLGIGGGVEPDPKLAAITVTLPAPAGESQRAAVASLLDRYAITWELT